MEIRRNGSILFYEKTGSGARAILLFHGFGQTNSALTTFASPLLSDYTCYSFDLFFHGKSFRTGGGSAIRKDEWESLMAEFLDTEKISRFSVVGFSLGARFALSTAELFCNRIADLVLLAPDGLSPHPAYRLATSTRASRWVFSQLIKKPGIMSKIINLCDRLGLVHPSLLRTASTQLSSGEKRWRVYHSWVAFRDLGSHPGRLATLLNAHGVRVLIYLAESDRMINERAINGFAARLEDCKFQILPVSHYRLLPEVSARISRDLKGQNDS